MSVVTTLGHLRLWGSVESLLCMYLIKNLSKWVVATSFQGQILIVNTFPRLPRRCHLHSIHSSDGDRL